MENNIGKYFLYAIGEIILVMIGILLALQVNNWNEDKKNAGLKKKYVISLIQDIKSDSLILNHQINYMKKDLDLIKSFEKRLSGSKATIDTLKHIYNFEYKSSFNPTNILNSQTIDAMLSSGDINLFKKSVRDKMLLYNTQQKAGILGVQANIDVFLANINSRNLPPILNQEDSLLTVLPLKFLKPVWNEYNNSHFVKEFNEILVGKKFMEIAIIEGRTQMLKITNDYLNFLYAIQNSK